MPKLLLVCEYAALNGGEWSMLSTLPAVISAGFDATVVAPTDGPLARVLAEREIEVHPLAPREQRRSGLIEIIARCKGKDKKQLNAYMTKYAARNSKDWVRVYLPIDKFKKYGQANLSQVESVVLQIQKGKYYKVYVDYICLVRKDPGERGN